MRDQYSSYQRHRQNCGNAAARTTQIIGFSGEPARLEISLCRVLDRHSFHSTLVANRSSINGRGTVKRQRPDADTGASGQGDGKVNRYGISTRFYRRTGTYSDEGIESVCIASCGTSGPLSRYFATRQHCTNSRQCSSPLLRHAGVVSRCETKRYQFRNISATSVTISFFRSGSIIWLSEANTCSSVTWLIFFSGPAAAGSLFCVNFNSNRFRHIR